MQVAMMLFALPHYALVQTLTRSVVQLLALPPALVDTFTRQNTPLMLQA
jgi:hypothetical protein